MCLREKATPRTQPHDDGPPQTSVTRHGSATVLDSSADINLSVSSIQLSSTEAPLDDSTAVFSPELLCTRPSRGVRRSLPLPIAPDGPAPAKLRLPLADRLRRTVYDPVIAEPVDTRRLDLKRTSESVQFQEDLMTEDELQHLMQIPDIPCPPSPRYTRSQSNTGLSLRRSTSSSIQLPHLNL